MNTENKMSTKELKDLEIKYIAADKFAVAALNACREAQASHRADNLPDNAFRIYVEASKVYHDARNTSRDAWNLYEYACVDAGITDFFKYQTYRLYEEF